MYSYFVYYLNIILRSTIILIRTTIIIRTTINTFLPRVFVARCGTKIAVELDKDNPCKGVVSRELLELELGALTRDRASIERKLRLLPSESQDDIVIDGENISMLRFHF